MFPHVTVRGEVHERSAAGVGVDNLCSEPAQGAFGLGCACLADQAECVQSLHCSLRWPVSDTRVAVEVLRLIQRLVFLPDESFRQHGRDNHEKVRAVNLFKLVLPAN
eukprot:290172-Amphidinium_carterae.1